uniref:Uncharacterized protein n=1 Tax=Chrysotila carterae TaxID=13221 RepID=A0A7S4FBV5_CHRCT|mmetsp:Transcript_46795/g.101646  ORF Transcript_46795/g.101646 Transcript_46795/m.101646 type:complete len:400 (+) Transcript_46795:122-1321(+)
MTAALDQAVWPEDSSSGVSDSTCYAGILGQCSNCRSDGSCNCARHLNGMSDLLPMDRSEWGEPTLLCPNYEPVLMALNAAVCLLAAIVLMRVMPAIYVQAKRARAQTNCNHPLAPLLVLVSVYVGKTSILLYSALKLGLPDRVVGVDPLISLALTLREASGSMGFEAHLIHVVNVALNSQIRSLGEQRVLDVKARQLRHGIIKAITFSIFGQLPFIQSICAQTGRATSREAQTAFTLAFIACKVLAAAVAAIYLRIETRSLLSSFSDSIEAAQAGFIVASGGRAQESLAAQLRSRSNPDQSTRQQAETASTAHLQALLHELDSLEDAYENVRSKARVVFRSLVFSSCFWLVVAVVPPLWNRISYVIPFLSLLRLYSGRAMVMLYSFKRKPRVVRTMQRV